MPMRLSAEGLSFIKSLEGFRSKVYLDSAGKATIGYGHLLVKAERVSGKVRIGGVFMPYGGGLSEAPAAALLAEEVAKFEAAVGEVVEVPLSQSQFDALVSFAFNVGAGALRRSTLLRLLNEGRYEEVPLQLMRWVHAGGKRVRGLVSRRRKEAELWGQE